MGTAYIIFIHGVNVRQENYSEKLFNLICKASPTLTLKKIPLFWGNVNDTALQERTSWFEETPIWKDLWFQGFRKKQLLQFAGDAALYISRHVGSLAVEQMIDQALEGLNTYNHSEDSLHLVTHSWGTVILFDVLFANRWNDPSIPGHKKVEQIRRNIFGLPPDRGNGIRISSIHTMGSPIALFSLLTIIGNTQGQSSHDITPELKQFLQKLKQENIKLIWRNFIHPGDPVAWPLEIVLPKILNLDIQNPYIDIKDERTSGSGVLEFLAKLISSTFLALINGGSAHGSYWQNKNVAHIISKVILKSS